MPAASSSSSSSAAKKNQLNATEKRVYQATLNAPGSSLAQDEVMTKFPDIDPSEMLEAVNSLLKKSLFSLQQTEKGVRYVASSKKEASMMGGLEGDDGIVYRLIKDAGTAGIWSRQIQTKSNLHQGVLNRCLKSLEARQLVKQVSSVKSPTRRIYMLYHLTPSIDVSGGNWYTENKLDTEFISMLANVSLRFIQQQTWPEGFHKGNTNLYPSSYAKHLPTIPQVLEHLTKQRVTPVQLSLEEVRELLETLVFDEKIEKVPMLGGLGGPLNPKGSKKGKARGDAEDDAKSDDDDDDDEEDETGGWGASANGSTKRKSKSSKSKDGGKKKRKKKKRRRDDDESGSDSESSASDSESDDESGSGSSSGSDSEDDSDDSSRNKKRKSSSGKKKKSSSSRKKSKSSKSKSKSRSKSKSKSRKSKSRSRHSSTESGSESESGSSSAESDESSGSEAHTSRKSNSKHAKSRVLSSESEDEDESSAPATSSMTSLYVYRALRPASIPQGFTETPCARCPVFDFCRPKGPVNAEECVYYEQWIEAGLESEGEEDDGWDGEEEQGGVDDAE